MRVESTPVRRGVAVTKLDRLLVATLDNVRGLSTNAERIRKSIEAQDGKGEPITLRQRHALHAIAWRFRRQLPVKLQAKVAIELAEAKAAAEEFRMEHPPEDNIRSFRVVDGGKPAMANPLDSLFDALEPATS